MRKPLAERVGRMRLNLVSATLGYMGYGAAQWAMVIVLARWTTPEALGQFTLAFAVTAPVFIALDMQLRRIVASDVTNSFYPGKLISIRVGACVLSTVVIILLSEFLHYSRTQYELNLLVALAKSFESISDLLYGYFQRLERMHSIAISLWLKGIGSLAGMYFVVAKSGSIVYATAAVACAWFILLLLFDAPRVWLILRGTLERGEAAPGVAPRMPLIRMAGPLGIALVISSLGQNIPRYIVEARRGHAELGVYAAASYFFLVSARLAAATADTILPRLSRIAHTDLDAFGSLVRRAIIPVVVFSIVLAIAAIPLGRPLLTRIYGKAYGSGATTMVVVFLASSMNCIVSVLQAALIALRQINVQVGIVAAGALTTLLVSVVLVDSLGGAGAAIGLAAGLGVQAILSGVAALAGIHTLEEAALPAAKSGAALSVSVGDA